MLRFYVDKLAGFEFTFLSGIFLLISFIGHYLDFTFEFAWFTIIISATPIAYYAFKKLSKFKISSSLLITIAILSAVFIGEVFTAAEVAFIMAIGELLENLTIQNAKKSLKNLISKIPEQANLVNNDSIDVIEICKIIPNMRLRIFPGEKVPVDGIIIDGFCALDESMLTGESLPIEKKSSDKVFAGSINTSGSIDIITTSSGKDSTIEKLSKLIEQSHKKPSALEKTIDKFASIIVPCSLIIAILTYIFTDEIIRAVAVLVVFCPCALVLATPTSIMAAISHASKQSVIIKSSLALEKIAKVNKICFDKTGTLTKSTLKVDNIILTKDIVISDLISKIVSLEQYSEHPVAKAIVKLKDIYKVNIVGVKNLEISIGYGVSGVINGEKFSISKEYEQDLEKKYSDIVDNIRKEGKIIVFVNSNNTTVAILSLSDEIRAYSKKLISNLIERGIEPILLTGDNEVTAKFIGENIGVSKIYANQTPQDKANLIKTISKHNTVCMVGDGINDAVALKCADVSIAIAKPDNDVATSNSDIVLISDDISKLSYLFKLASLTIKNIKFNIFIAMSINMIALILSIFGFLSPVFGALVHNLGTIFVILSSIAFYKKDI